jgi:hypothetical protein
MARGVAKLYKNMVNALLFRHPGLAPGAAYSSCGAKAGRPMTGMRHCLGDSAGPVIKAGVTASVARVMVA